MELTDVPRHRPLAFDKMESLIKEMQDPESGVPVRSQKLFLTYIPSAFMASMKQTKSPEHLPSGYDLVEWLMDRFNLDETSNVEAINLANQLCQYGYFFPVNDSKNLVLKDDSSLYRFQSPYYWPWQPPRVGGSAPIVGPDNVEYAIYLVKRTLRNKQRHGLEDHEVEALANLKKNLAAKWDFITMQAEEQVRLAKDRKKGDKIVSDSQERAYWRVARPPPGMPSVQDTCPVPVRSRVPKPKKRTIQQLTREIEHLKASLDRTRVKTSIALEALLAYSETFTPYDPWLTPPQPSNPWISDDTLFWQINSPLVEVPSEKRVQRWALSIDELVSDPTGLQEFTSFLRKEYSHENIRFWNAVQDLRRSSVKQIPKKLEEIYEEFLKSGAPCEINIDGATADKVAEGLKSGSRYAFDHAAEHVYSLLLKKDCYPRFVRSDHFQRLLAEGKNVHQKKKFFNFGGQVKKKPGSTSGTGSGGLSRRRGSDRSLSGSAHELAVCAAQPRHNEPPPHSHSQSNLADIIPFSNPLDDDASDVAPWESAGRESYGGARRRQDSAADSGSSSSDVSAAVCVAERARRLPQQSTLDGGLRGAPPPLRRLSAVEPRHLAPLASPPREPRPPRPAPAPALPPHPTPTISVSSAPDDESGGEVPTDSPDEPRSLAVSDEPSSVFASADVTPTDPARTAQRTLEERAKDGPPEPDGGEPSSENRGGISDLPEGASRSEGTSPARAPAASASPSPSAPGSPVSVVPAGLASAAPSGPPSGAPTSPVSATPAPASGATVAPAPQPAPSSTPLMPDPAPAKPPEPAPAKPLEPTPTKVPEPVPTTSSAPPRAPEPARARSAESTTASASPARAPAPTVVAAVVPVTSAAAAPPAAAAPVAPLAVGEDTGVEDDHVDKVPSTPLQRVAADPETAAVSDATKKIAHKDELSSFSESNIVKRDNKNDVGDRKQRNDICPWEDENSCESDAPFVKTYATLGYL